MKTLKKTLCLVLAVVMVVGVLVLPANAAATTTEDTDATAAFKTLNEYGVMYGVDANNTPALNKNINRQDMAAIIYRIMTGDTAGAYVANYAGSANTFADSATFATWAKGYIGYVRNQGIFVGDNNGNFKPTEEIKGNDVLTVLLRCLGYGQNGEFTGPNYAQNALTQATQLHMFGDNGVRDDYDFYTVSADMSKAINRGTVAKLTCNASINHLATYFNGTYTTYRSNGRPVAPNTPNAERNPQLLAYGYATKFSGYTKFGIGVWKYGQTVTFNAPDVAVKYNLPDVVIYDQPVKEYWTPVTHCQVAQDLGFSGSLTFNVYTNGAANKTTTTLYATNTQAQIGAQGRHTLIFDAIPDLYNTPDTIVYIDTLLAEVRDVTPASFDAAGHLKKAASLTLRVFDGPNDTTDHNQAISGSHGTNYNFTEVTKYNGATNYSYTKGQYLLVNAVHTEDGPALAAAKKEIITYEDGDGYLDANENMCYDVSAKALTEVGTGYLVDILGVATSISGAQSKVWSNLDVNKHTVAGTDYNDNNRFHLDEAGIDTNSSFTWYFDTKGNLIGAVKNATAHAYGVITSMWSSVNSADGTSKVLANVTYMDGTTETLTVGSVTVSTANTAAAYTAVTGTATQQGSGKKAMAFENATTTGNFLYVNEAAATNKAADLETNADSVAATDPGHGIIFDNLFQITTGSNGVSSFVEVAGNGASGSDPYKSLNNETTTVTKGLVVNGTNLKITDSTQFLIGSIVNGNYVFSTVTGYKNIVNYQSKEVDWVDANSDGYADYVYITADPTTESGWHIFFADANVVSDATGSNKAMMKYANNGSTTTVYGWLDGVEGSVTIRNTNVKEVGDTSEDFIYGDFVNDANGHTLWLVKIDSGYVVDVNGAVANAANANIAVNGSTTANKTAQSNTNYNIVKALKGNAAAYGMDANLTGTYQDLSIIVCAAKESNHKVDASIYEIENASSPVTYTIDDKTVVIGDIDDIDVEAKDGKPGATIIIVYNGTSGKSNLIAQMYIINDQDGTGYVEPPADTRTFSLDTSTTCTYTSGTVDILATLTSTGGNIASTEKVTFKAYLQIMNPGTSTFTTVANAKDKEVTGGGSNTVASTDGDLDITWTVVKGVQYQAVIEAYLGTTKVASKTFSVADNT